MTTPSCAVRARILSPAGQPIAAARVSARLNRPDVAMAAGYVAPAMVNAVTDVAGLAVLDLWPNALGATASQYVVDIVTPAGDYWRVTATVPDAATADLEIIAALPAYPGKSDQQVALETVQAYAVQAGDSAAAADLSAGTADVFAATAGAAASAAAAHATAADAHRIAAGEQATLATSRAADAASSRAAADAARSSAESAALLGQGSASAAAASETVAAAAAALATAEKNAAQAASTAASASASGAASSAAAALASENATRAVVAGIAADLVQLSALFAEHLNNT